MSSNLKPEPINRLTTKIGVVEGRKTNIKIGKTKKAKTNFKNNGVLSSDQKWKIYKSEIEPKLTDRIFEEEEPDNKMLEIIKEALKETNVNIGKILRDTKKEPTDIHSDIITPSHIDTSLRDKLASAAENRVRTKDATDKLEGIFKRRNVQTQIHKKFNEEKQNDAVDRLVSVITRKAIEKEKDEHGGTFKEIRKRKDDNQKEYDFLNKPVNTGIALELNKELKKQKEKLENKENKEKFGNVLKEIKSKEPKLVKNKITSLNSDITTLMKNTLDKIPKSVGVQVKSSTNSVGNQTDIGSGNRGRPTSQATLTALANTYTPRPRNINRTSLNTSVYQTSTPENRRFSQYYGFSPNPYLNTPLRSTHPARAPYPSSTPPSRTTPKFSKL